MEPVTNRRCSSSTGAAESGVYTIAELNGSGGAAPPVAVEPALLVGREGCSAQVL